MARQKAGHRRRPIDWDSDWIMTLPLECISDESATSGKLVLRSRYGDTFSWDKANSQLLTTRVKVVDYGGCEPLGGYTSDSHKYEWQLYKTPNQQYIIESHYLGPEGWFSRLMRELLGPAEESVSYLLPNRAQVSYELRYGDRTAAGNNVCKENIEIAKRGAESL